MEHIRQFDWCSSEPDIYFLKENDLDNCVTERILRNKFHDPLISSDSEEEGQHKFDWNKVFKRNYQENSHRGWFVAGMRALPPYPRLSALTRQQHYQALRILSAANPRVLHTEYMPRPTKQDFKAFQEIKQTYEAEQQEYIEWAKTLWTTTQCVRALRPKPTIETVYEAEFQMRAAEMESFPKHYEMAAHISFECKDRCELEHVKDLVNVKVSELPCMDWPELSAGRLSVLRPCAMPQPCTKHPTRMVLPNEKSVSILPLTEVHRSLCQYAVENGARCVVSEGALRCLVRGDQWALPVSVADGIGPGGEKSSVLVLGSEFPLSRGYARTRTYRALRHLLEYALIPPLEKAKVLQRHERASEAHETSASDGGGGMDVGSDDEEQLVIAFHDDNANDTDEETDLQIADDTDSDTPLDKYVDHTSSPNNNKNISSAENSSKKINGSSTKNCSEETIEKDQKSTGNSKKKESGLYKCTCKDSIFEIPPPRSYRKWQLKNSSINKHIDIIVHCSHKARDESGEVILEPIPEYQLDLGGSAQPEGATRALGLALRLRRTASVVTARVDAVTGELVTVEQTSPEDFHAAHGSDDVISTIYAAVDQLMGLLPGHYLLRHEPSHGNNALLYAPKLSGGADTVTLEFDSSQPLDETASVKVPPVLAPVLLPVHKHRKILPCAFTPFEGQVAKEQKKPPAKQKPPPQAIRWPKRKGLRKKKKPNNRQ